MIHQLFFFFQLKKSSILIFQKCAKYIQRVHILKYIYFSDENVTMKLEISKREGRTSQKEQYAFLYRYELQGIAGKVWVETQKVYKTYTPF